MQLLNVFLNRYWNDKDVLQKLGEAMGFAVSGEATSSAENAEADETEEANEDESVVHHTASVGDVEVHVHRFSVLEAYKLESRTYVLLIIFEVSKFICVTPVRYESFL